MRVSKVTLGLGAGTTGGANPERVVKLVHISELYHICLQKSKIYDKFLKNNLFIFIHIFVGISYFGHRLGVSFKISTLRL